MYLPCHFVCKIGFQKMCVQCLNHHCKEAQNVCQKPCFPAVALPPEELLTPEELLLTPGELLLTPEELLLTPEELLLGPEDLLAAPSLNEDAILRVNPCVTCLINSKCSVCALKCTDPTRPSCSSCVREVCSMCLDTCRKSERRPELTRDERRLGAYLGTPSHSLRDDICEKCLQDLGCCTSDCSGPSTLTRKCQSCIIHDCDECIHHCIPKPEYLLELDVTPLRPNPLPPLGPPSRLIQDDTCKECLQLVDCCMDDCSGVSTLARQCQTCVIESCHECIYHCIPKLERLLERELDTSQLRPDPLPRLETCRTCIATEQCEECTRLCPVDKPANWECLDCVRRTCPNCILDCKPHSQQLERELDISPLRPKPLPCIENCWTCIAKEQCEECMRVCSVRRIANQECLDCVKGTCPNCELDCRPRPQQLDEHQLERELDILPLPLRPNLRLRMDPETCLSCLSEEWCQQCGRSCTEPPFIDCFPCVDTTCPQCRADCTPEPAHGRETELRELNMLERELGISPLRPDPRLRTDTCMTCLSTAQCRPCGEICSSGILRNRACTLCVDDFCPTCHEDCYYPPMGGRESEQELDVVLPELRMKTMPCVAAKRCCVDECAELFPTQQCCQCVENQCPVCLGDCLPGEAVQLRQHHRAKARLIPRPTEPPSVRRLMRRP